MVSRILKRAYPSAIGKHWLRPSTNYCEKNNKAIENSAITLNMMTNSNSSFFLAFMPESLVQIPTVSLG